MDISTRLHHEFHNLKITTAARLQKSCSVVLVPVPLIGLCANRKKIFYDFYVSIARRATQCTVIIRTAFNEKLQYLQFIPQRCHDDHGLIKFVDNIIYLLSTLHDCPEVIQILKIDSFIQFSLLNVVLIKN